LASTDLYFVFSNPIEGREDEYNTWYDDVHLADVRRLPGVVSATRYEYLPTSFRRLTAAPTEHRYLAVYELESDAEDVLAELVKRAGTSEMPLSEALDVENVQTCVWKRRTA
jgi:hypothetical protein